MKEKFNIKDVWFGALHVLVAMSSILFVCGMTGINLPLSFLTVGIGTLVFHLLTNNKLAVLMGVSGSFIGGMTLVAAEYGPQYVAGGVVISGAIYLIVGFIIKSNPALYNKFPKYILNAAVLLIALNLMPIGASMASGNVAIAAITILVGFCLFIKGGKIGSFAFPAALIVGTLLSVVTGNLQATAEIQKLTFISPEFNLASFTLIGVVGLAVVFESLGDSQNCANAQGIELDGNDFSNVLIGNGLASTVSGTLGGLPLTTYSENVGFIYLTGYKRPMAQICSAILFILMAFVPGIGVLISYIPGYVYGAMLLFLFSLIGINSIKSLFLNKEKGQVVMAMLIAFFLTPASLFSPIAGAVIVGVFAHIMIGGKKAE